MTAFGTIENAVEAMKLGAYDFVQKPVDVRSSAFSSAAVREYRELRYENILLKDEFRQRYRLPAIVGRVRRESSKSERDPARGADRLDGVLQGESGTGKELFAAAIINSRRGATGRSVAITAPPFRRR